MNRNCIVRADRLLIPDRLVDLVDGEDFSGVFNEQKQDIVLNGCQLHHITVYPDFLQVIVYAQTSCLVDMSMKYDDRLPLPAAYLWYIKRHL